MYLQDYRQAIQKGNVAASAVAEHVFIVGHKVELSKAFMINYHTTPGRI